MTFSSGRFTTGLSDTFERVRKWSAQQIVRWMPTISTSGGELTGTMEQAAVAGLQDTTAHRRWESAAILGRNSQRSNEAIAALIDRLGDSEPFVRWQVGEALAAQEAGRVFPALCAAMADADPLRRASAAETIGRMGGEAGCAELKKIIGDPEPTVRAAAARALAACADASAIPVLLPLLRDRDAGVRAAAAHGLGRIGDPGVAGTLADALVRAGEPVLVRRALAAALVRTPHPVAQPALFDALADPDPQVRGYAAQALGQVGNEAAWNALSALEHDNSRLLRGTVADAARQAKALLERRGRQAPVSHQAEAG